MPLAGFVCPSGADVPGRRNPITFCLGDPADRDAPRCERPCMAPPLLSAIYTAESTNYHQGHYISASLIAGTGCPRQVVFERTEPYYEQASRKYWAVRGTHAHTIIERGSEQLRPLGWLQELQMSVPLTYADEPTPVFRDGVFTGEFDLQTPLTITLKGTCDAYNPLTWPYPLWDLKSMADVKAGMMIRGEKGGTYCKNIDDRWFWQLQIYRYLIAKTKIPPEIKQEFGLKGTRFPEPKWVGIQGISMMTAPRTGMAIEFQRALYDVSDIPVLPLDKVEQFIRPRLLKWYRWLVLEEPAPVVNTDMAWICRTCCFNGEEIAGERCFPKRDRATNAND
jgi:hypothetical protein